MPRRSSISLLTIEDLQREIKLRQRQNAKLEKKRQRLLKHLALVEAQMGIKGGSRRSVGVGSRPRNEMSLLEALKQVMKGKTMSVGEAVEAVQKAGYRSSAANFRVVVNATLLKHPKVFKRAGRGEYSMT
jgi:hypothetical protein